MKKKTLKPTESEYLKSYKRLHGYCYDACPKCGKQKVREHYSPDFDKREYETYHYLCCACGYLLKRIRYLKPKLDDWFEITFDEDGTPKERSCYNANISFRH